MSIHVRTVLEAVMRKLLMNRRLSTRRYSISVLIHTRCESFRFLSYLCVIYLILPAAASAQTAVANGNSTKVVRVVRVDTPPVIDGRLDEAVWAQAEVITDFHQIRPGDGTPPSERTEVYLLYGDDALYIGARMYDSEPDRIAAPTVRHGQGLGRDDRLVVILDPFNTQAGRLPFRDEQQRREARRAL